MNDEAMKSLTATPLCYGSIFSVAKQHSVLQQQVLDHKTEIIMQAHVRADV